MSIAVGPAEAVYLTKHFGSREPPMAGVDNLSVRQNPHASLEDYSRVMLQHTQRQMAALTHANPNDGHSMGSDTSRRGNSSGQNGGTSTTIDSSRGKAPTTLTFVLNAGYRPGDVSTTVSRAEECKTS
jgi:hypothetical protein